VNWAINVAIFGLIVAAYVAYREGAYVTERVLTGLLVLGMGVTVLYGILKLGRMQKDFTLRSPHKDEK
jgi:hypothetical protein